jgi:hypothetical protein
MSPEPSGRAVIEKDDPDSALLVARTDLNALTTSPEKSGLRSRLSPIRAYSRLNDASMPGTDLTSLHHLATARILARL